MRGAGIAEMSLYRWGQVSMKWNRRAGAAVTSLHSYSFDAFNVNISCALSTYSCKRSGEAHGCPPAAINAHDECLTAPPSLPGVLTRGFTKIHKLHAKRLHGSKLHRTDQMSCLFLCAITDVIFHSSRRYSSAFKWREPAVVDNVTRGWGWGENSADSLEMVLYMLTEEGGN